MGFATTIEELKTKGYKFENDGTCKGCGEAIEWWTTPKNKKIPMNHGTATPHWSTCPNAGDFRSDSAPTSKITTATLNMDWLKGEASKCFCVVCRKITGR